MSGLAKVALEDRAKSQNPGPCPKNQHHDYMPTVLVSRGLCGFFVTSSRPVGPDLYRDSVSTYDRWQVVIKHDHLEGAWAGS